MRKFALLLLLVGCSKSGPTSTTAIIVVDDVVQAVDAPAAASPADAVSPADAPSAVTP